jgi:hypothetical protein
MQPTPKPRPKHAGLLRLYPELLLVPDDDERNRILRRHFLRGTVWAALVGGTLAGPFNTLVITPTVNRFSPLPYTANAMVIALLIGLTCGLSIRHVLHKPTQRRFRRMLAARGIPICVSCGYNLRAQTEPRCPECGRPFEMPPIAPSVAEPYVGQVVPEPKAKG